ncbi:Choline oxidase [Fusarium oxysporum f. sp. albedinis]|nr:Choline oxidase [Fusarium oxysporum f. sp. albedinis]
MSIGLKYEEINQHQVKMAPQPRRTSGSVSVCEKTMCKKTQQVGEKQYSIYQRKNPWHASQDMTNNRPCRGNFLRGVCVLFMLSLFTFLENRAVIL